ncbi:MAG: DUF3108 domain-containing protein [Thermodesulfobacteriota bacterium]
MKIRVFLLIGMLLFLGSIAHGEGQGQNPGPRPGKSFSYIARKIGVPILKATIGIENEPQEQGRSLYRVYAKVESLDYLRFLFRMNNRFTSIAQGEMCSPVRYVKEIDQEGLLVKNKNYVQTLTFDHAERKVVVERKGENGREEISLPPETYDPLSMFARYYLREEFHPGKDIRISLFDGVKLRQMVFQAKEEKVDSKMYGEVETIRLESTTPFSTFGDKEGIIRIWFLNNKEKIPILIELDLPVGNVKFELEEAKES